MNSKAIELLSKLVDSCSVSGYEAEALNVFLEYCDELGGKTGRDVLGSGSVFLEANSQAIESLPIKIALLSHIDSPGFVVTGFLSDGRVRLSGVGYPELIRHPITIYSEKGDIVAIPSDPEEEAFEDSGQDEYYTQNLAASIGNKTSGSSKRQVSLADPAQYKSPLIQLSKNVYSGAGLDNKAGVACLYQTMRNLSKQQDRPSHVYGVVPAYEETNSGGAIAAISKIKPFIIINIDTYPVDYSEVGKGFIIEKSPFVNKKLTRLIEEKAKKLGLKYQVKTNKEGFESDLEKVFYLNGGCVAGSISIPVHNLHSATEIVDKTDMTGLCHLLFDLCISLQQVPEFIPKGRKNE